ncbi:MAG TPA: acylphosphatase [Erysipelotrichaceae bacterium]|jgi:acylphosphatase|nr:acylphosphatase [Erysipelotrichaceae bacterium]
MEKYIYNEQSGLWYELQGVGFRYRSVYAARQYGATGWVRNESDGSVSMEIQGTEEQIDLVIQSIEKSPYIEIRTMDVKNISVIPDEREFIVKEDWWYGV